MTALYDDVGATVAGRRFGDVAFEGTPVYGVHRGHYADRGALVPDPMNIGTTVLPRMWAMRWPIRTSRA
ncbi:hypothetical protein [Streptomyces sp. NPDC059224]|uniref:hypothetical protein n=1 Tax=Streptomyces sp. NPDC059224 TaxID=3346775 RepID=UPI00369C5C95